MPAPTLGWCPSAVRPVFPMLVLQPSKQQNRTRTSSLTVPRTPPNRSQVEEWLGASGAKRRRRTREKSRSAFQFQASDSLGLDLAPAHPHRPLSKPKPQMSSGTASIEAGRNACADESLGGMHTSVSLRDPTSDLPHSNENQQVPPTSAAVANTSIDIPPIPNPSDDVAGEAQPSTPISPLASLGGQEASNPQSSRSSRRDIRRQRQAGSFSWGRFWFGHRPSCGGRPGSYEVTCKIHSTP